MKMVKINKNWILILISVISFLALLIILLDVIAPQKEFSLSSFLRNMGTSIPFAILIAIVDYQLVRYINNSKWFAKRVVLRIVIESLALIVLALIFIVVGNIPFLDGEASAIKYFSSGQFYASATAAILINIFTGTMIEFFVQVKRNDNLQKENLRMQYQQLKSQINPHFLFNSLNVLKSLINKDSEQASHYTQKLSNIYRYVLTQEAKEFVCVYEEIEFIKTYIEVLRIRYGEALSCEIEICDTCLELSIPPMSLQLLVENAVKHNAVSPKKPLIISIKYSDGYLEVSNNIIPRIRVEDSTGIGLKNLEQKYEIISNKSIIIDKDIHTFNVKLPLL